MKKSSNPIKIIFTSPTLKYPPIGGPATRIFNSLIALSKISEVHVLFQTPDDNIDNGKISKSHVNIFKYKKLLFQNTSSLPLLFQKIIDYLRLKYRGFWQKIVNFVWANQIVDYARKNNIKIIWFGFGNVSYDLIRYVRKINPKLKLVCDTDSVWSRYVLRRIKFKKGTKKISLIREEGKIKQLEEEKLTRLCDVVTAVSDVDKKYYVNIAKKKDKVKVKQFSNVINPSAYKNVPTPLDIPSGDYIYMSGTFGSETPMEDAACWFIEKAFPLLRRHLPNIKLLIVGISADWVLLKYKNRKNIIIKGWVRSTVPYLKHAKVSIVPLRFESGTRFKILEAGICSIPVVSTTLGAEGLDVENGENIIIADSPAEFAKSILKIINNPIEAKVQSDKLHKLVLERYTIKTLIEEGKDILKFIE